MSSTTDAEPDQPRSDQTNPIIYVGQDKAGHWLVQDSGRRLEGRFVSRGAAMSYAHAERQTYHAEIQLASEPLIPVISFSSVGSDERALSWAA